MKTSKTFSGKQFFWWSIGSINLLILLLLLGMVRTGDRALNFVANLFEVTPAELKTENTIPLTERIRNIQELSTTVQTMETIVPASAQRKVGDMAFGTTKLLYIARGEIRAGVDLNELTDKDIKVAANSIEVNLPAAKILDSKIDVNHSRVYDYDRGFLNLGPDVAPQLQTLAQRKTLVQMVETACNEGILQQANIKAKEAIVQFLTTNKSQEVKVKTTPPSSCDSEKIENHQKS